ncbi:MAG: pyridoxal-phosphate dependent enzyme [Ardenticatenaceae bacterium]|nr:pyridoxal-phosphate dependent enzyme [Ardenticatenaceae bacterium]
MMRIDAPTLEEIRAAQERLWGTAVRTPLIRLNVDSEAEIYLKLENLQPIGCFKIRGAGNAIAQASPEQLAQGVYTASAGNMAQGVGWWARRLGVPFSVVVPDHAPQTKLAAIARLGGEIIKVPWNEWWQVIVNHRYDGLDGLFIHPVSDPQVVAGNGTIGLEIVEDLPDVDVVITAFGGGGLSCGVGTAVHALRPQAKIYAAEPETAQPVAASLAAGDVQQVTYTPSFVDGAGGNSVLPEMWPLVQETLAGSIVVTLEEVKAAIRHVVERNRVVAEGAGALPVAAALSGKAGSGKIVCVVSGGNVDTAVLVQILQGG